MSSPERSQGEKPGTGEGCLDAFGLAVETDGVLPDIPLTRDGGEGQSLKLLQVPAGELPSLLESPRFLRNLQAYDGAPYAMLEGPAGDVLFVYGRTALFHLSTERDVLRYTAGAEDGLAWQRVLLDTILWTISLLNGYELLHAAAVSGNHGLLALATHMGGGKTSLAAEFLMRGAALFSDDVVALDSVDGRVLAYPGPPLMNLPRALSPEALGGRVLAEFADERWTALARAEMIPMRLTAIVLINRVAGEIARCEPIEATSLTLLPHAVSLPHLQNRARRRFDIFSSVVATTPVFVLHADPSVPPCDLADLIEDRLNTT